MSNPTSTPLAPHPEYYINGGDLYLVAGNTQYRVHSYFFERDSEYFRKKLNSHAPLSAPRLGSSDANAIIIKRAGPNEFEKLLWVFYNPKYSLYEATASEWITILKLACDYRFNEVKLLAIRGLEMSNLTTVQRIQIYELYHVERQYLVPLYDVLCRREECLTEEEAKELGLPTTLLIFRIREILRSQSGDGSDKSPLPASLDDVYITRTICSSLGVDPQSLPGAGSLVISLVP
ncbi:hypothetical protein JR316_0002670 [Psilocybe cubensis]|uniref:BTB domain-containing protein n=2 Tax=Psilocybe cubensis TaxID=181762 RepID=A0A8H7Y655_PSICU|nr:hypothetical protein JR316_0002670 [Psilocybe cubensis]KAH9485755.1 hypothetical protein JR316_0002670 [Psilocybe cubensis]